MQTEDLSSPQKRSKNVDIVRVMLVKDSNNCYKTSRIAGSKDAVSIVKDFLAGEDREVFVALNLGHGHKINSIHVVSIGTVNMSLIHPREVFKAAILSNATGIVIGHNHPSGDPTPSQEDKDVTRRLFDCGKMLGINVFDHIIIGDEEYSSIQIMGKDISWQKGKFKDWEESRDEGQTVRKRRKDLITKEQESN